MILAYGVLIPVFLLVLWAFFRFSPKRDGRRNVGLYNGLSVLVAVLSGGGYAWHLYVAMSAGPDSGWWPVLASGFFLATTIGVLGISGLMRNFVFYRRRGA